MYVEMHQKIYVFGYVYFVLWPSRFHMHGHLTVLYACSNIRCSPHSDSLDASSNQPTFEAVWLFILHSGVLWPKGRSQIIILSLAYSRVHTLFSQNNKTMSINITVNGDMNASRSHFPWLMQPRVTYAMVVYIGKRNLQWKRGRWIQYVQEPGDCHNWCLPHSESTKAIKYICPHMTAPVSGAAALCKFLIPSGPLLHQSCRKHTIQAKDQAEEPQHVDPHSRGCWFEWLNALHCKACEGCPIGDVEKLSRYLSKECIGRITRIRRQ